jgi:hypothetical protein
MSYRPESKPIKDTGTSGSCLFEMALVFRLCLIAYILKRADTQVLFLLPWIYEQDRHNRNHISRLYGEGRRVCDIEVAVKPPAALPSNLQSGH